MRCGDYFGNTDTVVVICDRQSREIIHMIRKWPVGCGKKCMYVGGKKVRQLSQKWKENQSCKETRAEMGEACKVVKLEGH